MDVTISEQMSETIIRVDQHDIPAGPASKYQAHRSPGLLHRAFSVLLFDGGGRLLLQKRAAGKMTFPGAWANSCCSHPAYCPDELEGREGAGVKRAAIRRMQQELGVQPGHIAPKALRLMTRLHYRAGSCAAWVEQEIDYILLARADVELAPNPDEVESVRWVSAPELQQMLADAESGGSGITIAPWFRLIAKEFLPRWWPCLGDDLALENLADSRIHRFDLQPFCSNSSNKRCDSGSH